MAYSKWPNVSWDSGGRRAGGEVGQEGVQVQRAVRFDVHGERLHHALGHGDGDLAAGDGVDAGIAVGFARRPIPYSK